MNLVDLLLTVCIRFLAWVFSIRGRYSVARQQWEYGRYRSALAALSRYLFHVANAMVVRKKWKAYTEAEMKRETQTSPPVSANINVTHVDNTKYSIDQLDRLYDAQARQRRQEKR